MKVIMAWEAYRQMLAYVNAAYPATETGTTLRESTGWGTVQQLPSGELYVDRVFLMAHDATRANVDLTTPTAMQGWADLVQKLADEDPDSLRRLNVWWHSHPFGSQPAFSAVDTGTMERFKVEGGFLLSIVTSEKGDMAARYDQWTPVRQRFELEVEVEWPAIEVDAATRAEVLSKVTFPYVTPAVAKPSAYGGGGGPRGGAWESQRQDYWESHRLYDWPDDRSWAKPVDTTGSWEVWRRTTEPYRISGHKKKKEAEKERDDLSRQNGTAVYVVVKTGQTPPALGEFPMEAGVRDASDDMEPSNYQVWAVGEDLAVGEGLTMREAVDLAEEATFDAVLDGAHTEYFVAELQADGSWDAVWWESYDADSATPLDQPPFSLQSQLNRIAELALVQEPMEGRPST